MKLINDFRPIFINLKFIFWIKILQFFKHINKKDENNL